MAGVYDLLVQGEITAGVLGSAWLGNRVWKGKRAHRDDAAQQDEDAEKPSLNLADPNTPVGMLLHRMEADITSLERQLSQARDQVVSLVENNARLKAEKTAVEERNTQLERRNLELEARIASSWGSRGR